LIIEIDKILAGAMMQLTDRLETS